MLDLAAQDDEQPHLPGGLDIWVFVLGDMLIFSCYFAAYLFCDRAQDPELFRRSQAHLSQGLGIVNTVSRPPALASRSLSRSRF